MSTASSIPPSTSTSSSSRTGLKRMYIDQPSILHPFHHLHGTNVMAWPFEEDDRGSTRIYFLSGPVLSQLIQTSALSEGWL